MTRTAHYWSTVLPIISNLTHHRVVGLVSHSSLSVPHIVFGTQFVILHDFWMDVDYLTIIFIQFSSVAQLCRTLGDPMDCSTPGFPVHHQLPEPDQTHVHWVGDDIQPSHPLSSPSPPAFSLSQHQSLFKWVNSSHEVAKVMEFQPQHQSFQWTLRTDLL